MFSVLRIAVALVLASAILAPVVSANPVSYAERNQDAPFRAYVQPGSMVSVDNQCPHAGYFTEFQAYRGDGRAMGQQRTERYADGTLKRVLWAWHGRHVTFDGLTFRNHTRAPVWVAGWCS